VHITFRQKYIKKNDKKDHKNRNKKDVKKTTIEHYEDLILPLIENNSELVKLDTSKPIVTLEKQHKTNVGLGINFTNKQLYRLIKDIKNLKEVLVIEVARENESSYH
jgi:hypothetical protein